MGETALEDRITAEMASRAEMLELDARRLRVTFVLNWGGFVNRSYHVTDGARRYHLKLAREAEALAGLRHWRDVHELLADRYHAPPIIDWVALPGVAWEGPLFPHIDGAVAEVRSPELLAPIFPIVQRLHGDGELAARINVDDAPRPCRDTFVDTYVQRFREDVAYVAANRPAFVSADALAYMHAEAEALDAEVHSHPAFAEPATMPIHADLWLDNLMLGRDGRWWVLDWDGLAIGDPAMDWAMLLGPTTRDLAPLPVDALPPDAADADVRALPGLRARGAARLGARPARGLDRRRRRPRARRHRPRGEGAPVPRRARSVSREVLRTESFRSCRAHSLSGPASRSLRGFS